jgi:hypothetical protein
MAIASAIVGFTFASVLFSIHCKLFWVDELLEYYSDTKLTAGIVILDQLHRPFSLEPPAFHILLHFMDKLPFKAEFSSRILSALSLIVTQICTFRITARLTKSDRAALFALILPFSLATWNYAAEARVYGVLTAVFAIAIVCYQSAIEDDHHPQIVPSLVLFLSLATAILLHYFGIILVLPFLAAEITRCVSRKRLSWPIFSIISSVLISLLNVPFIRGLSEVRAHYKTDEAAWRMIPFTYVWFIDQTGAYHISIMHTLAPLVYIGATAALLLLVTKLVQRRNASDLSDSPALLTLILAGSLLPVFNLVVAHYFAHAYVPRYSLPAVVPGSVGLAVIVSPWFQRMRFFLTAMLLVVLVGSSLALQTIGRENVSRRGSEENRNVNSDLASALTHSSDQHIYIQASTEFLTTFYYASPELKARMVGVESREKELLWLHQDPSSIFMRNIGLTTSIPVVQFECLEQVPGPHVFIVYHDPTEEWIDHEIDSQGVKAEPAGNALSGVIYRMTFPLVHVLPTEERVAAPACMEAIKQSTR